MAAKTAIGSPEPDDSSSRRKASGKKRRNGEGHIRQRKDGRYEAQIFVTTTEGTRKRVSVYGKDWDECHDQVTKLKDQERRGLPAITTTMTVGEYMRYWLYEIAEPSIRRTTFTTYEGAVRLHIIPGLGKRKLKALQAAHIRTWLGGLRKVCQCCAQGKDAARAATRNGKAQCCAKAKPECCKAYLSSSSIRHLLRVMRAALQDAVDEDLLARNVARLVQLTVTDGHKVRAFTAEEARRLLTAAREHRLYALWAVALAVGLRRGESLGLSWDDVDLVNQRLTVRQALHRVDRQLKLEDVKTEGSNATIPLPTPLVRVLQAHRKRQLEERFEAGKAWRESGLVFTTKLGGPIEPRNVNRMFGVLCTKAKVRQVRVHDLRHSCATLLFTMGVEAATVQRILRHSSITVTTGTYVEVIERVQRDALDTMGTFFDAD
ncbi:tyrosine-type recombinase/integrase [Umezawaea endophytica]|uniref:Site-specific integrase n=1 Tax=Umezawaea endophytica TaxID=1654476 RepID=A0A9X2VWW0_9PSEU|nr:site-specific integrase [Umezawaea endophytica]MCS7484416.1 site-specific integrase [Umezawaea endophytica]